MAFFQKWNCVRAAPWILRWVQGPKTRLPIVWDFLYTIKRRGASAGEAASFGVVLQKRAAAKRKPGCGAGFHPLGQSGLGVANAREMGLPAKGGAGFHLVSICRRPARSRRGFQTVRRDLHVTF